jgi:hypothetical protein
MGTLVRYNYRIYKNLHKNCYSVQSYNKEKRGYRLLLHTTDLICHDVSFKVFEGTRQKVLLKKRKSVHAFIQCNQIEISDSALLSGGEFTYNPYKSGDFFLKECNTPIKKANKIYIKQNKCFLST